MSDNEMIVDRTKVLVIDPEDTDAVYALFDRYLNAPGQDNLKRMQSAIRGLLQTSEPIPPMPEGDNILIKDRHGEIWVRDEIDRYTHHDAWAALWRDRGPLRVYREVEKADE